MHISTLLTDVIQETLRIAPETTLAHLAERFLHFKAEYAVVEDNGVPVGVVPVNVALRAWARGVAPQTPVKEFMNSSVVNVSTSWHWSEACRCLAEQAASYLIVSDPAADTLAVLTERDVCQQLGSKALAPIQRLEDFICTDVPIVSEDASLIEVTELFVAKESVCVVVLKDTRPVGLILREDLIRLQLGGIDPDASKVADIGLSPAHCISVQTSLPRAFQTMLKFGVTQLVVTDDRGKMVGLLGATNMAALLEDRHVRDLHLRHRAVTAALDESEARRKAILDGTHVFLGLLDRNGVVLEINGAALRAIGVSLADVAGQPFEQTPWWAHDPAQQTRLRAAIKHCQEVGGNVFESVHHKANGKLIRMECHLRPIHDAMGGVMYLLAEGIDITRRKKSEQALYASHQHYAALLESSPVGVFEANAAGECVFVNPTYEAITGFTFNQVRGLGWVDSIHPDDRERILKDMRQNQGGQPCCDEYRRIRPDGDVRWILSHSTPIVSASGAVTGVIVTLTDITEQKKQEDLLLVMGEALKQSNKAIALTDNESNFRYVNTAFCELFGYQSNEVLGRSSEMLVALGAHEEPTPSQVRDIVSTQKFYKGEVFRRAKDGVDIPVLLDSALVTIYGGTPLWHINTYTDLTSIRAKLALLDQLAHHDALTKLPNRVLLTRRLELELAYARRNKKLVALFFVDLDNFKQINDTFGHHVGDLLLQELALRLKKCVRESDTVARIGGDEFAVLLSSLSSRKGAEKIARKIMTEFDQPFCLEGQAIRSGASIGIALYPQHADNEHQLLLSSDSAMYKAKARGRGVFVFAGD